MNQRLIEENTTGVNTNQDDSIRHNDDTNRNNIIINNDETIINEQDYVEDKRRLQYNDYDDHSTDDEENTGNSKNEDEQDDSHDANIINDETIIMIDELDYVADRRRCGGNDYDDHSTDDDASDEGIFQYAMMKHKSTHNILNKIKLFPTEIAYLNHDKQYPLHNACYYNYSYVAIKLMDAYPEAIRHQDYYRYYPLHAAIYSESSEVVIMKLIASFPEAVHALTIKGETALYLACNNNRKNRLSETVIRKLIEIDPFAVQIKDKDDRHPIWYAIQDNHKIEVIKMLLDGDPL